MGGVVRLREKYENFSRFCIIMSVICVISAGLLIKNTTLRKTFRQCMAGDFIYETIETFMPVMLTENEGKNTFIIFAENRIGEIMPLYAYIDEISIENEDESRMIYYADVAGNDDYYAPSSKNDDTKMQAENVNEEITNDEYGVSDNVTYEFVPHGIMQGIDLTEYTDYDALIKRFYTIDNSTSADENLLNVTDFEKRDMTITKSADEPQILIYHTHSQEAFADSVPGDESTTIMGAGDRLSEILTTEYGYNVLHHRGKYDVETRDEAYSKALPEIEQILNDNPSIQVVIDLHRDEMNEATRLVTDIDGRPTAKFMFFNGLSRTKKTGSIAYLYNENLQDNLAFSFKMQLAAEIYYPDVTRKIYLKSYRYNMHLKPRSLLIELGAQNNTVEEVMNACDVIAHILDLVLTGEVE
jgi:stage II sporulation protein P